MSRWGSSIVDRRKGSENSLESIGRDLGLTRERVRQIIKKLFFEFKNKYIFSSKEIESYLCSIIEKNYMPINTLELYGKIKFSENIYNGFLHNIFPNVPIKGYTQRTYHNQKFFFLEIYKNSKTPYSLDINDYLYEKDTVFKLNFFSVLFTSIFYIKRDGKAKLDKRQIRIDKLNDKVFINHVKYPIRTIIKNILDSENRPMDLLEIARKINKSIHSDKTYEVKNYSRNPLIASVDRVPGIIYIDKYVVGFEEHLSYQRHEWKKIQELCINIIKQKGHQLSASFIYNKIKNNFIRFVSKYELVHILRQHQDIVDLGFFNFSHISFGQKERLMIKDIVTNMFDKTSNPKHASEVLKEIRKYRTVRREAIAQMATQWGFCKYIGNYIGLKARHETNLVYLSNKSDYLKKYIDYSKNVSLEDMLNYLNLDDLEVLREKINKIDSLVILKDNYSENEYIINKEWTISRKIKIILKNNSQPLTIAEIKWDLDIKVDNKQIHSYLKSKRYGGFIKKIDQKFSFVDVNYNSEELSDLMELIEDYLKDMDENISLDELYTVVKDLSSDIKSREHLISIMNQNEDIFIANNMVGLLQ